MLTEAELPMASPVSRSCTSTAASSSSARASWSGLTITCRPRSSQASSRRSSHRCGPSQSTSCIRCRTACGPSCRRCKPISPIGEPSKQRTGGKIEKVMLLGEKARKGDQGGKCQRQLPQLRLQMERGKNGYRYMHAGEAVRARIETLHQRKEALRRAALPVVRAPVRRSGHRKEDEERHLQAQQQHVAHCDVRKVARRFDDEVKVEDERLVDAAVDPHPARPIRYPLVDSRSQLPRSAQVIALAPEIELVRADDQNHAQRQIDDVVSRRHDGTPSRRSCTARMTAAAAECTSSLRYAFLMWLVTVCTEIPSRAAICP